MCYGCAVCVLFAVCVLCVLLEHSKVWRWEHEGDDRDRDGNVMDAVYQGIVM